jgi:hypothetical protein
MILTTVDAFVHFLVIIVVLLAFLVHLLNLMRCGIEDLVGLFDFTLDKALKTCRVCTRVTAT